MREIKFRAWDGKNMHNVSFSINAQGTVMWYNRVIGTFELHDFMDFPPMQFTGLLDNNGKEIYEGDIVKIIASEFIYEVKFPQMFSLIGENHEIIGNIYENPELIK